jgi:hypothetical protein
VGSWMLGIISAPTSAEAGIVKIGRNEVVDVDEF